MKYMKSYILFALMGWAVTSCTLNDLKDDVDNLKDRVTLIEQQVKLLNDNLAVAGFVLDPQNKLITDVKEKDGQFVIELTNGDKLNLTIGKPGTVNEPVITIENGYWVINGIKTNVKAAGENGKNGEGFPEFRVEAGKWQVRFGEGAWTDVQGGTIEGITGSLGDQIFESAKVEGKNFVVTLKDGNKVITLPIVEKLACAIDETGLELAKGGYLELEAGTRTIIPVKVNGDEVQVTYPQGWRATVTPMAAADEKGNNYQLAIFAPNAEPKVSVRANAESAADVCVLVQKGNFWAIDKIKVRLKEEAVVAKTDLEKYNAGQSIVIGGLEISKKLYGEAVEVKADQAIDKGGVYFVSKDGAKLTYALGAAGVDNLIVLPATEEVKAIHFTVKNQIYVSGTFVTKHVVLDNATNHYPLRVVQSDKKLNIVLDACQINGLLASKGLVMKHDKEVTSVVEQFTMSNSDVKLEKGGTNLYLLTNVACDNLTVNNNLIYTTNGVAVTNFKVYDGQNFTINKLEMNSKTLIDVESSSPTSQYGLLRAELIVAATIQNNIYWLSNASKGAFFISGKQSVVDSLNQSGNVGFSVSGKELRMFLGEAIKPADKDIEKVADLFATSDLASFNKDEGIFVPKAGYTQFGAQR